MEGVNGGDAPPGAQKQKPTKEPKCERRHELCLLPRLVCACCSAVIIAAAAAAAH